MEKKLRVRYDHVSIRHLSGTVKCAVAYRVWDAV